MKKLLLTTAACGVAFAAPAYAQVELELGGYFKGYGAYVDQDETNPAAGSETNEFDIIRDTEIHFGGETTLDSGLTVGAHIEASSDTADGFNVDESYIYMSGGWGRVNIGGEDGAAYLLQVAAPSADSNIDGIRQYVQPVNYTALNLVSAAAPTAANVSGGGLDYDQDPTGASDKLTYLSPILNGFQLGLSYTPDVDGFADDLEGIGLDNVLDTFGSAYEAGLRYQGQFNNLGVTLGAGYSFVELEQAGTMLASGAPLAGAVAVGDPSDDREVWNVGADFDLGAFGLGMIYRNDNGGNPVETAAVNNANPALRNAARAGGNEETYVVGVDYTTGPFKLGASYLDQNNTFAASDEDTKRYSGGVVYTYGPGMTFRGSVGYIEHEDNIVANQDVDATYVTLGTQINF